VRKSVLGKIHSKLKILALFFIVSMIHLYPILKNFFTMLPYATIGDVSLSLAILYSNVQKLGLLQFSQLYHLPFLFPLSNTLTIGFTLFGQSVLLLPFFLFGQPNIYGLYNGLTIFSYLAAGIGAYLFFKELQDNETVAVVSASLYILLPFRVYNIPHLNLLMNFPIPFSLLFLLKYLKTGRKKDLLYLNVFLLSQFLFDLSLGFYLSVSLAFLVLIFVLIKRPLQFRHFLWLFLSLLPTMAVILFIHFPFLQKNISLSPSDSSFNPDQYLPAMSFYANKSTILYILNKLWDPWPLFPGFSVILFYFYAFYSYVSNLRDKLLLAVMVGAYAIPGLIAVVFFQKEAYAALNSLLEICLLVFFASLAVLLFSLRKKIPLPLKMVSLLLMTIVFITFKPFPKIFDLFNALASIFPFLHRSRGLRTAYILPLASIGVFAFGLKAFLENKRRKKIYLWAIVLVLLLEHFRWPIAMAKLPEANFEAKKIYKMVDPYPHHFGILELPFVPTSSNMYSLFTQYHNKHTYHGHYLKYDDPLNLEAEGALRVESEFEGLKNPALLNKLKDNGLNLIMISKSFIGYVYDKDVTSVWRKIRQNIKTGQESGLFKEVKETTYSVLIVLDDSRTGQEINYNVPYFALIARKNIQFKIRVKQPTRSHIYFNGHLIAVKDYPTGEHQTLLPLLSTPKQKQINRIRISSDQPVTIHDWLIK
jgi:hypothetical protein